MVPPSKKLYWIDRLIAPRRSTAGRALGHSINEDEDDGMNSLALEDDNSPTVRVKLCLRSNHEHCGEYTDAESKFSRKYLIFNSFWRDN